MYKNASWAAKCHEQAEKNSEGHCVCLPGWGGNGVKCGEDKDQDTIPETKLDCDDPTCQVSRNIYFTLGV